MKATVTLFALAAATVLASGPARGQDAQRNPHQRQGFAPDQAYAVGEIENISLFSRALVLTIPISSFPVAEGFGYSLTAVYSSNVWDFVPTTGPPPKLPVLTDVRPSLGNNAGLGWRVSLGALHAPGTPSNPSEDRFKYVGADGGEHVAYPTLHVHEADASTAEHFSRDGSYLRLRQVDPSTYMVDFPSGVSHRFAQLACTPPPEDPGRVGPGPRAGPARVLQLGVRGDPGIRGVGLHELVQGRHRS